MSNATAMSEISRGVLEPIAVGRFRHRDGSLCLLPYAAPEFLRSTVACAMRIGTFHFRTGDQLLLTSLMDETVQFGPIERALRDFGMVLLSADASYFDAARTESILRRFEVAAVAGVNAVLLDGLEAMGQDPRQIFAGRVVWARPDACARLAGSTDIRLRRIMEVGPALAMECVRGEGAHIDRLEWQVDEVDGEIVLGSRLHRALDFHGYRTGIMARLERASCACGSSDPRVIC